MENLDLDINESGDVGSISEHQHKIHSGITNILQRSTSDEDGPCAICLLLISHENDTDPIKMSNLYTYLLRTRENAHKVSYDKDSVSLAVVAMVKMDLESMRLLPVNKKPHEISSTSVSEVSIKNMLKLAKRHCMNCEISLNYTKRQLCTKLLGMLSQRIDTEDMSTQDIIMILRQIDSKPTRFI